jgi:N-acetylglucosamine malate deacetylase 1
MMNPYERLVAELAGWMGEGKNLPLGGFPLPERSRVAAGAPKVLIFSPHPDDECIIGGLAVRLQRESGWEAVNVAVTLGSNKERRAGRLAELQGACDYLGLRLVEVGAGGLESVNLKKREGDAAGWQEDVRVMAECLQREEPRLILFPHGRDNNSTHIGTHYLLRDALERCGSAVSCWIAQTEFWSPMRDPNLMVELSGADVARLITALSFHAGEVRRNPYHVRTPCWMIDNVRRGSELVGGQGGAAPEFVFATLYRVSVWRNGSWEEGAGPGRFVGAREDAGGMFPEIGA